MIQRTTLFGLLRREALPLALACALALLLQLAAVPMTLAQVGEDQAQALSSLCLGSTAADEEPGSGPLHHIPGLCPCGPVCPHSASVFTALSAVSVATAEPPYRTSLLVPLGSRREAPLVGLTIRAGAIRAPPPARI